MVFSQNNFKIDARNGVLEPARLFSPLYRVSRVALTAMDRQKRLRLADHFSALRLRMPKKPLQDVRLSTSLAWRFANGYFPAFRYHVGEFINDEWLACVDWHKKFHRDHVSHQVMCHWVAKKLVNAKEKDFDLGEKTLKQRCIQQIMSPPCQYLREYAKQMGVFHNIPDQRHELIWEWIFDETLFLATMFHDIGYPWQFVQGIADKFSDHCPQAMSLTANVSKLYDEYAGRLICYPLHGYHAPSHLHPVTWRKHAEEMLHLGRLNTHGLPGAFAFLFLNDLIRDYPEPQTNNAKGLFCIEWAAMAIMMHDMQKVYVGPSSGPQPANPCLRVCFEKDPLSFVVALVDQIQDFCRPNARFDSIDNDDDNVRIGYPHGCSSVDVKVSKDGPMNITFFFKDRWDAVKNSAIYKREAEKEYFDPCTGYLDWTGLPITGIHLDAKQE